MGEIVTLKWIADHVVPSAYAWATQSRLDTQTINGVKYVSKETVDTLAVNLASTCSLAEASRLTGIPKGSMRYYIDELHILKTKVVAGRERVLRDSIESAKEYLAGHEERVRERNRQAALSAARKKKIAAKAKRRSEIARRAEKLNAMLRAKRNKHPQLSQREESLPDRLSHDREEPETREDWEEEELGLNPRRHGQRTAKELLDYSLRLVDDK